MTKQVNRILTAFAIIAMGLVFAMSSLRAELVYDEAEDREGLRKVLKKSQVVETNQYVANEPVMTEPVVVSATSETNAQTLSQSELLRRERLREEMKNEDLLQQRLENLRYREEKRRTEKLLKSIKVDEENEAKPAESAQVLPAAPAVATTQMVVAPVTDTVGVSQSSATTAAAVAVPTQTSVSAASEVADSVAPQKTRVTFTPRFGIASMSGGSYEVSSNYSFGLGLGFSASEHVGVEFGYNYNQYNVRLGNNYQALLNPFLGGYNTRQLSLDQHVIDLGIRFYLLGQKSTVRPYIGGGGGYAIGTINYNQNVYTFTGLDNSDYNINQVLGFGTAGSDFRISENFGINVGYKFLMPLTSYENEDLNNTAFFTGYNPIAGGLPEKEGLRGSVRQSNVHLIQVGASLSF